MSENKKKTILILGGLGFIGKNLVKEFFASDGYNIVIFNSAKEAVKGEEFLKKAKIYSGDFNNTTELEDVFKENKIDIVFHLISTTVPANSNNSGAIFDINSNLVGTINLLELMRKYEVNKIVFFSSGGTVYGLPEKNLLDQKFSEKSETNPISSHGIVKLTIEKYIRLFNYFYNFDYLILRLSNPFGEYHSSDIQGFINVALKKIINGAPVVVWGDGEVVRDYIYIRDCAKIIRSLVEKNISNELINIGCGKGYSINEILAMIKKVVGGFEVHYKTGRKFDVLKSVLDTTKLKSLIDYEITDIEEGIRNTYEWLLKNKVK